MSIYIDLPGADLTYVVLQGPLSHWEWHFIGISGLQRKVEVRKVSFCGWKLYSGLHP